MTAGLLGIGTGFSGIVVAGAFVGVLIVFFLGAVVLRAAAWIAAGKLEVPFWRAAGLVLLCGVLNYILNLAGGGALKGQKDLAYVIGYTIGNLLISLLIIYGPILGYLIKRPIPAGAAPLQPIMPPNMQPPQPAGPAQPAPQLPPPVIFTQAVGAAPVQYKAIGYGRGVLVGLTYFGIWLIIGFVVLGLVLLVKKMY